jgi:hypothetical protein
MKIRNLFVPCPVPALLACGLALSACATGAKPPGGDPATDQPEAAVRLETDADYAAAERLFFSDGSGADRAPASPANWITELVSRMATEIGLTRRQLPQAESALAAIHQGMTRSQSAALARALDGARDAEAQAALALFTQRGAARLRALRLGSRTTTEAALAGAMRRQTLAIAVARTARPPARVTPGVRALINAMNGARQRLASPARERIESLLRAIHAHQPTLRALDADASLAARVQKMGGEELPELLRRNPKFLGEGCGQSECFSSVAALSGFAAIIGGVATALARRPAISDAQGCQALVQATAEQFKGETRQQALARACRLSSPDFQVFGDICRASCAGAHLAGI